MDARQFRTVLRRRLIGLSVEVTEVQIEDNEDRGLVACVVWWRPPTSTEDGVTAIDEGFHDPPPKDTGAG